MTTSLTCLTLFADDLAALESCEYRAFRAASQSKGERTDRALKGDLTVALRGESRLESEGDGGRCRLGNDVAPVGGADIGCVGCEVIGALVGDLWPPHLQEQSVCSLLAVDGTESCAESSSVVLPDLFSGTTGEDIDMDLRKSMYATGGVMGVLSPLGNSSLMKSGTADKGVLADADRAESSEGNVAVTGVVSCASFGLLVGIVTMWWGFPVDSPDEEMMI